MKYKIFPSGDTLRVSEGALVTLDLAWYGKDLQKPACDSRSRERASSFNTLPPPYPGSIEEGLYLMKRGDSAVFDLRADSMFQISFAGQIPPEAAGLERVLVSIKLIDVDPSLTFEEREKRKKKYDEDNEERRKSEEANIKQFLYLNNTMKEPDSCGVWHIIIKEGGGRKPLKGERVVFQMTGRVLDGTIFEGTEKEPVTKEFTIDGDPVPQGLNDGIKLMNQGEKALIIVPSSKAFGGNHMGNLPPYSTLLLEIELLDIKANKP
jgi:FKBP-type peptidyl-prolyl cis-trans isomerase